MTNTTGSQPKELQPGLKASFTAMYGSASPVWKQLFRSLTSEKNYEEIISLYATGLVDIKSEGKSMTYDDMSQGLTIRHTPKVYAKGVIITEEAMDDNLYASLSKRAIEFLTRSHLSTEEYVHAGILNNGFTVVGNHQQGGDGKVLFSASHTARDGTYSNLLTAASLSASSLEDALTQIRLAKDESGVHFSNLDAKNLVVPEKLRWEAQRILKSTLQPGNANNDVNVVNGAVNLIPWNYLSSETAWFVTTNADYGLVHYDRKKLAIRMSNDTDTYNEKIQSSSRYVAGSVDNRGVYGNVGA